MKEKYLDQARSAFEKVCANDKTADNSYINAATAEIDRHLSMLEEYNDLFPDLQDTQQQIKSKIISPKAAF
ncbi:hypothetical protein [Pseudomonas syringae]|uniref:hypothetical protein n=1 Tax=Pseudomonas syringae TaxID=317 RepID=UPI0012665147|nr:hypothetical protein [Pseudomonas syringae]